MVDDHAIEHWPRLSRRLPFVGRGQHRYHVAGAKCAANRSVWSHGHGHAHEARLQRRPVSGGELHPCEELLCRDWGQQLLSVDRIHGFGWHEHLRLRVRELRLGNGEVRATHTRTGWQVANSDDDPMRARAA